MSKDGLDIESLLALNAMSAQEQYDDDEDESLADYDPDDDDEAFGEFDDDDDDEEAFALGFEEAEEDIDDDDDDDGEAFSEAYMGEDLSERRRRRRRRRSWRCRRPSGSQPGRQHQRPRSS